MKKADNGKSQYSTVRRNAYAQIIDTGGKFGFILITICFIFYFSGIIQPHVPIQDMPSYWKLSATEFMKITGIKGGWNWITLVKKADYMNFIGICLLSSLTAIANLRILPILLKEKDKVFLVICIIQIIIIGLAASGLLAFGH